MIAVISWMLFGDRKTLNTPDLFADRFHWNRLFHRDSLCSQRSAMQNSLNLLLFQAPIFERMGKKMVAEWNLRAIVRLLAISVLEVFLVWMFVGGRVCHPTTLNPKLIFRWIYSVVCYCCCCCRRCVCACVCVFFIFLSHLLHSLRTGPLPPPPPSAISTRSHSDMINQKQTNNVRATQKYQQLAHVQMHVTYLYANSFDQMKIE